MRPPPSSAEFVAPSSPAQTNITHRPLYSNQQNVSKRMRLMRHTGTHDKKYRLVLSATRKPTKGPPQQQSKLSSANIRPPSVSAKTNAVNHRGGGGL